MPAMLANTTKASEVARGVSMGKIQDPGTPAWSCKAVGSDSEQTERSREVLGRGGTRPTAAVLRTDFRAQMEAGPQCEVCTIVR